MLLVNSVFRSPLKWPDFRRTSAASAPQTFSTNKMLLALVMFHSLTTTTGGPHHSAALSRFQPGASHTRYNTKKTKDGNLTVLWLSHLHQRISTYSKGKLRGETGNNEGDLAHNVTESARNMIQLRIV